MGRYDLTPTRVHRATTALLSAGKLARPPRWYQATTDIPPQEILTRTLPVEHSHARPDPQLPPPDAANGANFVAYPDPASFSDEPAHVSPSYRHLSKSRLRKMRKPRNLFQPRQIDYEEDELRTEFFTDHPWELARPRSLVENNGKDHRRWDWSRAHQPGRPISGESVIQRQLYLMKTDPLRSKASAYDQARKEFYEQRHHQEVERRIAREEADAVGANSWGKTANEVGMLLESKTFEQWKAWAKGRVVTMEQAKSAAAGMSGSNDGPDSIEAEEERGAEASNPRDPESSTTFEGAAVEVARGVPGTKKGQVARGGALFRP